MKYISLFIFFLILVPSCTASGILDILGITQNEKWDLDWSHLEMKDGVIERNVSSTAKMKVSVAIVGFEGLYKKDGVFYYPGDPTNNTVVQYEVQPRVRKRQNEVVDTLYYNFTYDVQNESITVILDVDMLWYEMNQSNDDRTYYWSHISISDTEIVPMEHIRSMDGVSAHLKICNNTFNPKTLIVIPESNRLKTEIVYKNESIVYYDHVGFVEYTDMGYPYINLSGESLHVSNDNELLRRIGPYYSISGSNFSESNLSITIHGLYTNESIDSYTIFEETYESSKVFHPSMFLIIGILLIFTMGIYKMWRIYK